MAEFVNKITDAGAAYLAERIANHGEVTFVRMAFGDGALGPGEDGTERTALVHELRSAGIVKVEYEAGTAVVRADFSNVGLAVGFDIREVGLFVDDPGPGVEILLAYGNAGNNTTFMPAGGAANLTMIIHQMVVTPGNVAGVTAVINQQAVYATQAELVAVNAAVLAHVGVGGAEQHPLATALLAGFMSAADKTRLDAMPYAYKRQYTATAYTTLAAFLGGAVYGLGRVPTWKGEIAVYDDPGTNAYLFSANVRVAQNGVVQIPVLQRDGACKIYVDGVLVDEILGNSGEPETAAWNAVAGDHLVQFLFYTTDAHGTGVIAEWFGANVTFLSTPA